jgi:hypothetical protein
MIQRAADEDVVLGTAGLCSGGLCGAGWYPDGILPPIVNRPSSSGDDRVEKPSPFMPETPLKVSRLLCDNPAFGVP